MGIRKRNRAEALKDARKNLAFAKLNNCPTSPRKMRLVADLIRGLDIDKAINTLKFNPKEASKKTYIGVNVSKKSIPLAYRRNRIKRQIRAMIIKQERVLLFSLPPGFYMFLYNGKFGVSSKSLFQDIQGLIKSFAK